MSEQKEWTTVQAGYSQGNGNYSANAYMILNRFDVSGISQVTLNFEQGWNMFSLNINPLDPSIETIMNPIVDDILIVKNNDGETYIPRYGINDIGNINYLEGYQIYLKQESILDIQGQLVDPATPISLPTGWSLISYLPQSPINAATALATIESQLLIAKNNGGETYIPRYGINDIGNMQPGQGYQVCLTAAGTLTYPATGKTIKTTDNSTRKDKYEPTHFRFEKTGENATVVIPATIINDDSQLETGDEIGIFTKDCLCCGAAVWLGANTAIPIMADDLHTEKTDGCQSGDELHFHVWKKSTNEEYAAHTSNKTKQDLQYQKDGFTVLTQLVINTNNDISGSEIPAIPSDFRLHQNHPNPFNPLTTIEYQLPEAADIKLTIYDLRGNEVKILVNGAMPAGYHSIMWDSRNNTGQLVSSGVYFYKIEVKSSDTANRAFFDVKKMIFMK
jgi:hypothetical protein